VIDAIFELLMLAGRQAGSPPGESRLPWLAGWPAGQMEITERPLKIFFFLNSFFSLCWIKDFSKYLHPKTKSKTMKIEEETEEPTFVLGMIILYSPKYIGYGKAKRPKYIG